MYKEVTCCRICGNPNLVSLLDLGNLAWTGVFPQNINQKVEGVPLELVKCQGETSCGLVQLKHSGDPEQMYGDNYGYRSGLNQSMVRHLHWLVDVLKQYVDLKEGDLILDIGSNDATMLKAYEADKYELVGMDPTGAKFKQYYPSNARLIPDFFSAKKFREQYPKASAKVVTSIAMFYDLENPQKFVDDIASILADDGIWVFEQSYLPTMLEANAYDTICHEHLEYYAMRQIDWLLKKAGMRVLHVELTDTNGGSSLIIADKGKNLSIQSDETPREFLAKEQNEGVNDLGVYETFKQRVFDHKDQLIDLLSGLQSQGKTVFGLGASTKGNALLQFCEITPELMPFIAEVNEDKFGKFTPGTCIPIISQEEADKMHPDYYLVLPWHFREGITKGRRDFLASGGKLIFPLPKITVVEKS